MVGTAIGGVAEATQQATYFNSHLRRKEQRARTRQGPIHLAQHQIRSSGVSVGNLTRREGCDSAEHNDSPRSLGPGRFPCHHRMGSGPEPSLDFRHDGHVWMTRVEEWLILSAGYSLQSRDRQGYRRAWKSWIDLHPAGGSSVFHTSCSRSQAVWCVR